jgi:3-methyl-2-oxobutanoate hydroxymethyltransferase
MPFGSYQDSTESAVRNAVRLMQAGAHMVKLEGGGWTAPIARCLTERGIPLCAHLGFTPQSVHALGGYRVQGREENAADQLYQHALELTASGAALLVIEMVPAALARDLTQKLSIPVIGIGAGVGCSGQVLVLHDMLGMSLGKTPRFVRNFLEGQPGIEDAVRHYVAEVKASRFPQDAAHGF